MDWLRATTQIVVWWLEDRWYDLRALFRRKPYAKQWEVDLLRMALRRTQEDNDALTEWLWDIWRQFRDFEERFGTEDELDNLQRSVWAIEDGLLAVAERVEPSLIKDRNPLSAIELLLVLNEDAILYANNGSHAGITADPDPEWASINEEQDQHDQQLALTLAGHPGEVVNESFEPLD